MRPEPKGTRPSRLIQALCRPFPPYTLGILQWGAGPHQMLDSDIEALRRLLKSGNLEPFIRHIRFPYFKNFAPDTRIDFTFPITAIVGPNGTNKSSIIKALYGAPGHSNLGNYWFSTSVDPIKESGDGGSRHCFIHGYCHPTTNQVVEVLKTRIQKSDDPDYWEPSRPIRRYGMAPMTDVPKNIPGRSKTRWDAITKDVIFIDFRHTLSAFDRLFYSETTDSGRKKRKARIRHWAPRLGDAIATASASFPYYGERIVGKENLQFDDNELQLISKILGRPYTSVRLIHHNLYAPDQAGYTAQMRYGNLQYTEAFAGSGEFATVMLVLKLNRANERSLVLLDEPEVSLFPGAQERLISFLVDSVKKHKHQVVLATHSPTMLRGLPEEAIKLVALDAETGLVRVVSQKALPEEAFVAVGAPITRPTIYAEDRLAVEVVLRALRSKGRELLELVQVEVLPGGADAILGSCAPIFAATDRTDVLLYLDGDKRPDRSWPDPDSIPAESDNDLSEMIATLTKTTVRLPIDGGLGRNANVVQKTRTQRQYLSWCRRFVDYLPGNTPEDFILHSLEKKAPKDSKTVFVELARKHWKLGDNEQLTSDQILEYQRHMLLNISEDSPDLTAIADTVRRFIRARPR